MQAINASVHLIKVLDNYSMPLQSFDILCISVCNVDNEAGPLLDF